MKEPLNTPEWWAAFFEWDRLVQLEFVNEALMAEFKMETNVAENVAMDALESWCEHKRVHDFSGEFTVPQLAVLWAAYELSVQQTASRARHWDFPATPSKSGISNWPTRRRCSKRSFRGLPAGA